MHMQHSNVLVFMAVCKKDFGSNYIHFIESEKYVAFLSEFQRNILIFVHLFNPIYVILFHCHSPSLRQLHDSIVLGLDIFLGKELI